MALLTPRNDSDSIVRWLSAGLFLYIICFHSWVVVALMLGVAAIVSESVAACCVSGLAFRPGVVLLYMCVCVCLIACVCFVVFFL